MDTYWAKLPQPREQAMLFSQSLDDALPKDHAARQLDAILEKADWSAFEARYHGLSGQTPIHPRYVAGAILYGLMTWTRSSRCLEFATRKA